MDRYIFSSDDRAISIEDIKDSNNCLEEHHAKKVYQEALEEHHRE